MPYSGFVPWEDIVTGVVLFCIFALVMAFSFRLALKPAIEALIGLREQFTSPDRVPGGEGRVAELSDEVEDLREEVERLREARDFDRRLRGEGGAEGDEGAS